MSFIVVVVFGALTGWSFGATYGWAGVPLSVFVGYLMSAGAHKVLS